MKIPAHIETTEDIVQWGLGAITKERDRRREKYGEIIDDRLLYLLPLFRMTHCQRARKCFECGESITQFEIHFVLGAVHYCQRGCMRKPLPPQLRLIRGGLAP